MASRPKKLSSRDFRLLLTFLNDPNERTASLARDQARSALQSHPALAHEVSRLEDLHVRRQAELLVESLWHDRVRSEMLELFRSGADLDLEKGAILLSTIAYPELDAGAVRAELDRLAVAVDKRIAKEAPLPTRPIIALRRQLFEIENFRGNEGNYNDPDNSFLNRVLERRLGIPISLSCVYLLVASRLNLTVHGIGLPGHFIVGHRAPRGVIFVDPYRGGRILRRKDCEVLVRRLGFQFHEEHLDPVGNDQILARMMLNLINVYTEEGFSARAHWLAQLFQAIQG